MLFYENTEKLMHQPKQPKPSHSVLKMIQHLQREQRQLEQKVACLMSDQAELVSTVASLKASVKALEDKVDTTPGSGSQIDQAVLDQAVVDIKDATARIDAETAKK
jgi:predicted  nucleic acid-binding Zn-ribbon protein